MLNNIYVQYAIIAIIITLIVLVVLKLRKKNFNIEANKLITYLGGKDNIINAEANMSRFKVILKDTKLVDKEGIQKLGAQGIVEIDNQVSIEVVMNSIQMVSCNFSRCFKCIQCSTITRNWINTSCLMSFEIEYC